MSKTKSKRNTNAIAAPARALLDAEAKKIMVRLIRKAVAGNIDALQLCIERIIPITRERTIPLAIPAAADATEVIIALEAVFAALSDGQLTPSEAQKLAAMLENQRKAIETQSLEDRLLALEEPTQQEEV